MMGLLIDSQFLIDISCDSMHISCQKCCHADWDCNSLVVVVGGGGGGVESKFSVQLRPKLNNIPDMDICHQESVVGTNVTVMVGICSRCFQDQLSNS